MIRIERLTKRYGPTEALRGLSFEVPRGQVVGFLGLPLALALLGLVRWRMREARRSTIRLEGA